ncbi:MAG TPA: PP2C family protein-serine/threonine phosphatase [Tepidisphaeraceae bacterium]|jgi:sigma-B regulation protein RsbU (phosphoserine phosphatase)|nr:PP2C family protein-serine/threonine phosphatase [Tepidisphaeraceae bacterium]
MPIGRRPWQEELAIIDRTMKAISDVTDPETFVNVYYDNIGSLIPGNDYVSVSRRNVPPPYYLITRSSRFKEHLNPWKQRDLLPRMTGGLLGEIAYANQPVIIDDVPSRLKADDPAHFYLEGFQSLVALPHYEANQGINVTIMLSPPGREMDKAVIPMLHWQSGLFGRGTTNLVLRNQLSNALQALDRELQVVGEIQRSLLPPQLPKIPGFEIAAHYQTSARAGGDYYDFFPLSTGGCGLFIADVSGHGTPAAVFMAITHAIAHTQPGTHTPPAKLLEYLNHHLARTYTRDGSFVTAFYAVLDATTRTLTYSRAGHNPPRLLRAGQIISLEDSGALPLGILDEQSYAESTITLEKDDLLLLYTDGITEASPPAKAKEARRLFGTTRLDQVLLDDPTATPTQTLINIRTAVATFTDNSTQSDDQTLLALRCLP